MIKQKNIKIKINEEVINVELCENIKTKKRFIHNVFIIIIITQYLNFKKLLNSKHCLLSIIC